MKRLLLASLLTFSGLMSLLAQNNVHLYGTVTGPNGGGQENVSIMVSVFYSDSTFCQNNTTTGADGTYDVLMSCTPMDTNALGFVQVSMVDCNNTIQNQYFTAFNQTVEFEANFFYCQNMNPDSCVVIILEEPNPGSLNYLTAWTPPGQTATYNWSTMDTTQSIYPFVPGTYCVTVTLAPLGCTVVDCYDFVIDSTGPCFAYIISTPLNNNLYNLQAIGTGTAPFTYAWSTGETSQFLQAVSSGTYCVVVTDSIGCVFTTCIIIPVSNFCEAYINEDPNGGLTANGFGVPPVTYLWNTGDSVQTIYPQVAGLYCVTVTDANLCEATSCYNYWFPMDSCITFVTAYVQDSSTLVLQAGYSGFGQSWTYQWSTGESTEIIYPQDPFETYCVTITDSNGCVSSGCYDPTNWCYVWQDVQYLDTATAIVTAYVDPIFTWPGAPLPVYEWSTGDTGSSITTDSSGYYCVTVTFTSGCSASACIEVNFEDLGTNCSAWVFQYPDSTNTSWYAQAYAWGYGELSYLWSTGDTTNTIQLDPNEFACVTVTTSFGCEAVACTDTLYNPCSPIITINYISNTEALLVATAFNNPNQNADFLWSTGEVGPSISVNVAGTYCVTVTGGGCTGTACTQVYFMNACGVAISVSDTMFGTLFLAIPSGVPPFQYQWDNGSTESFIVIDFGPLDHCVTVTDANGCVATGCTYLDSCSATIYLDYSPDPTLHVVANEAIAFSEWTTGNPADTMLWLTLTQPGTYCVYITTVSGCMSGACITIDSLNPAQSSNVISGFVFSDTSSMVSANVHVFSLLNGTGHVLTQVGEAPVGQGGYYRVDGLTPGVYLVRADFNANSPEESLYIPTYHLSSTTWENATPHVLPNLLTVTTDIQLVHKKPHNGSGVIGGVITDPNHIIAQEGEDTRNLVGVANATILLNDVNGGPMDYVKSDQVGGFLFTSLPFGTYRLRFDIPGITSPDVWVTLTPENPEKLQINLIAENGSVAVGEPTSELIHLYPNPAKEEIHIAVPGDNKIYDIQVVDMQGRVVFAGSTKNFNGILSLGIDQMAEGMYQIHLINDNHRFHGRFIKQE